MGSLSSALFDFGCEVCLGHEGHANDIAVKELVVEALLSADGSGEVFNAELDPDVAVRFLFHVDAVCLAEVGADAGHLVLDVHEEGRVLAQIHLCCVKHPLEKQAARRLHWRRHSGIGRALCPTEACPSRKDRVLVTA